MKKTMKRMKWDVIMTSLLYVALGIAVLVMPDTMRRALGYLIGAFLIVAGAVSMIGYLLRDAHQNYFRNDFVYGLVEITIGIIVLYKIDMIVELVTIILGILVVASGCRKLQDVIDMKRMEYGNWIAMLVLAAVNVIFGVVLILNPGAVATVIEQMIGIGLIVSGVTDCVIACYFARIIKKYMNRLETVDSTYVEIADTDGKGGKKQPENMGAASQQEADKKQDKTGADRKESAEADVDGSKSGIEAGNKSEIEAAIESAIESGIESEIEAGIKTEGEDKGEEQ